MNIDWQKKKLTSLKWLGAGPAFLLFLIFFEDIKIFENGLPEGILLSVISVIMPAVAIFLVYWPTKKLLEVNSKRSDNV